MRASGYRAASPDRDQPCRDIQCRLDRQANRHPVVSERRRHKIFVCTPPTLETRSGDRHRCWSADACHWPPSRYCWKMAARAREPPIAHDASIARTQFADPRTGVAPGVTRSRNVRSRCRCSMCPAIHINSRSWLRSSSTHEPSDPPHRVVNRVFSSSLRTRVCHPLACLCPEPARRA